MYHEVWQNKFKDIIDLSQGKLIVDQSPAARRKLALSINDNVFKNLTKFSVSSFDAEQRLHKSLLSLPEKSKAVDVLINEPDAKK